MKHALKMFNYMRYTSEDHYQKIAHIQNKHIKMIAGKVGFTIRLATLI